MSGADSSLFVVRSRAYMLGTRTVTRDFVEVGPIAAMLARDGQGRVVLVSQYRPAVDATVLELPAGRQEDGESASEAACRELREETGFRVGEVVPLAEFWPVPGLADERMAIFEATDAEPGEAAPDAGEDLSVVLLTDQECRRAITAGEIRDGKTLIALLTSWSEVKA